MVIIGLTGNIGSGKSTIANYLRDLGAEVIDTDQIARLVVAPGTPGLKEIIHSFGPGILHSDGSLDRKALANMIFSDAYKKNLLESIVHPLIENEVNKLINKFINDKSKPPKGLVLEVPLLIEVGWHKKVNRVWLVVVDRETQIKRVMARDHCSRRHALDRIKSQMPQEEKIKYADQVIDNNQTPEAVKRYVQILWQTKVL